MQLPEAFSGSIFLGKQQYLMGFSIVEGSPLHLFDLGNHHL
jgi:hypothetical protein